MTNPVGDTPTSTLGPLPIVVGITGHRDLREEDIPGLEAIVRDIFNDLRAHYPSTPLIALSPLAEGADRLGARVALECGARLVAPLPMPRDLYERDFATDESRQEFESLLARADSWFEIPLLEGITASDMDEHSPLRSEQYGYMGAYVVRNSQFLIALWDGVPAHLVNGTGDIVTFNLEGVPERFAPPRSLLEPVESDPVYHVITPRQSNPNPVGVPLTLRKIHPPQYDSPEEAEESLRYVFERTDMFNRDALTLAPQLGEERRKSKSYIIDSSELDRHAPELNSTLELYATADTLAGYFARRTHGTLKYVFALVTAAAVIFDFYTHLFSNRWYLLLGYLNLLVITYAMALRSEHGSFQSKYLDYRALAEGLRVQFFWELADIRESIADYYLHKQRSELDWIRYAVRIWDIPSHRDHALRAEQALPPDPNRLGLVLRQWVEDQLAYYIRASKREEGFMHRLETWGGRLILVGITLALVQVVLQGVLNPGSEPLHGLLVAIALAPILAGLMIGYAEKRAFGDHAKQYERMSILFSNARGHLKKLLDEGDYLRACQLITELGKEALMENGDWVLIHRDRPIEVPKG